MAEERYWGTFQGHRAEVVRVKQVVLWRRPLESRDYNVRRLFIALAETLSLVIICAIGVAAKYNWGLRLACRRSAVGDSAPRLLLVVVAVVVVCNVVYVERLCLVGHTASQLAALRVRRWLNGPHLLKPCSEEQLLLGGRTDSF